MQLILLITVGNSKENSAGLKGGYFDKSNNLCLKFNHGILS